MAEAAGKPWQEPRKRQVRTPVTVRRQRFVLTHREQLALTKAWREATQAVLADWKQLIGGNGSSARAADRVLERAGKLLAFHARWIKRPSQR